MKNVKNIIYVVIYISMIGQIVSVIAGVIAHTLFRNAHDIKLFIIFIMASFLSITTACFMVLAVIWIIEKIKNINNKNKEY